MSDKSKIEWTDATWPVVAGCTKVSAGCDNCYAIRDSNRLGKNPNPKVSAAYAGTAAMKNGRLNWTGVVRPLPERLDWPLKWKKPRRIFVCNESDLFHPDVSSGFIRAVIQHALLAVKERGHTMIFLTKRADRMLRYFQTEAQTIFQGYLAHERRMRWGVSVSNQLDADEQIPKLLQCPVAVRLVNYEPASGPVDFASWLIQRCDLEFLDVEWTPDIHQIIAGGESGPGARPAHPDWFRSARDQCVATAVSFFFKQWGEWFPRDQWEDNPDLILPDDSVAYVENSKTRIIDGLPIHRVGKKAAGRLLDGREWNEFPPVG